MGVIAKLRYLRIAPRKVRLVADLIRGKTVGEAQNILNFTTKRTAPILLKLLKSAIASARHNFELEEENLYISKILVDEGPKYKRWMPRARGVASEIQKKTSHVTIVLDVTPKDPALFTKRAGPTGQVEKKPKKVKKVKKLEKVEKVEKVPKVEKPKFKPELEIPKPKIEKGIRRIFRRKAF